MRNLWRNMLDEWLPLSDKTKDVRIYLDKYIWSKRKQWAVAYFRDAFTLGASTTQRAESWHSTFKTFSRSDSLEELARSLQVLVKRQESTETKSRDGKVRWMSL